MRDFKHVRLVALVASVLWAGCATTVSPRSDSLPAYATAGVNYVSPESAHVLVSYLRPSSGAGPLVSAHRGGPAPGYPENALQTFERSLRFAPALIECDLRMTRDSVLVLMHDETLERVTTTGGRVSDISFAELRKALLRDPRGVITPFRVPTLDETLAWSRGRAILTLDVKKDVPRDLVVEHVRRHGAAGRTIVIVYSREDLESFRALAPDLVYSVPLASEAELEQVMQSPLGEPRMIGWVGVGEPDASLLAMLARHDIRSIGGTFGPLDQRAKSVGYEAYLPLIQAGLGIVATDEVALAAKAAATVARFAPAH